MACAASPHERNTTRRAKCCMDATGWRRRLRRAGGLHGGTVSRGLRRVRRPARIARRRGLQRAAASPARGSRRTPARCPGCGSRRYGAALAGWIPQITHARGVGAIVGIASSTYGHQCQKGSRMVVSQAFWGCFTWNTNPAAPPGARSIHRVEPAQAGRCCARPSQRGRWPRAGLGRCRGTGKRAVPGAALAGRRRVVGAVLLGGGGAAARSRASEGKRSIAETLRATVPTRNRTPAAPGAFVAMVVRGEKCGGGLPNNASAGERVWRHSLHFS